MSEADIIKRIIQENGNCDWIDNHGGTDVCAVCPFSRLAQKADGQWMTCVEAICGNERLASADMDAKYKDTAERKLIEYQIHETLEDDC